MCFERRKLVCDKVICIPVCTYLPVHYALFRGHGPEVQDLHLYGEN